MLSRGLHTLHFRHRQTPQDARQPETVTVTVTVIVIETVIETVIGIESESIVGRGLLAETERVPSRLLNR